MGGSRTPFLAPPPPPSEWVSPATARGYRGRATTVDDFAAYTGLRAGELTGLRVRDLNLAAGHVEVRQTLARIGGEWKISTPKSARSSRNVPLVDRVLDTGSVLRNYLRPAVEAEGLPQMRLHDLRHTFASLMLAAGFPPYEVSRWLGHANLATTDSIYAHLYPSDYSAHVDRFSAFVAEAR
jgi:integrase